MKRKIYSILSVLVTVGIMWYLFRIVPLKNVFRTVTDMALVPFLAFLILSFGQTFFRTWRYLLILNACGLRVPGVTMFLVTIVRNCLSDLLPARLGTLSYVYILTARLGVDLERALSSFAVAFIFDLIALMPLLLVALAAIGWRALGSFQLLALLGLLTLALLVAMLKYLPLLFRLAGRTLQRSSHLRKQVQKLEGTAGELERIKRAGVYSRVFTLSIFVRLCKYGCLYFLLLALLSSWGYGWKDMGPGRFFLGASAAEFSASLPISGIAAFGAYEGTWALAFSLLGFPQELAVTTGISQHLVTQVYGYSLGAVCLAVLLLPVFRGRSAAFEGTARPRLFVPKLLASVVVLTGAVFSLYLGKDLSAKETPLRVDVPMPAERVRLKELGKELEGVLIYTRDGRVRKVVLGTWKTTDLGEGKFVRWGPKGRRIAVYHDGTIYVMNADGSKRRKLVSVEGKAIHCPIEFHPNGEEIIYVAPGREMWSVRIEDGRKKDLGLAGKYNGEPGISADGKHLAARSDHDMYAVDLSTGKSRRYGRGCSSGISPDGNWLMHNLDGHRRMLISSRDGKRQKQINSQSCEPDGKWDNHHWSNDNDYIAAQGSGKSHEAYVVCISKDRGTRVTWEGGVLYPDLFVRRVRGATR